MTMLDPIAAQLGMWAVDINIYSIFLRIALSMLLSAVIGCERAFKRHAAGLRTFMLVSLASTAAALLEQFFALSMGGHTLLMPAATVIAVAILSGNSILFSSKNQIKGLTTSVALWACGIMGLTLGAGYYTVGILSFLALFCCLLLFPPLEHFLKDHSGHFEIHLELKNRCDLQDFVMTIRKLGMQIDDIESNPAYLTSGLSVYSISLSVTNLATRKATKHSEIIEALSTLDYISHIEELE